MLGFVFERRDGGFVRLDFIDKERTIEAGSLQVRQTVNDLVTRNRLWYRIACFVREYGEFLIGAV